MDRKTPCKRNKTGKSKLFQTLFVCPHCGVKLNRRDQVTTHLKICKKNLMIANQNTHPVQIIPYGQDTVTDLSVKQLAKLLAYEGCAVEKLIKLTNGNKYERKYHNILHIDSHDKMCKIYDGHDWNKIELKDVLEDLFKRRLQDLQNLCKIIPLDAHHLKKLMDDIDKFDIYKCLDKWTDKNVTEKQLNSLIMSNHPRDDPIFQELKNKLEAYENDPCCQSHGECLAERLYCIDQTKKKSS